MIDDIIKIAIGFVFTGILGSKISSKDTEEKLCKPDKNKQNRKGRRKDKRINKKNRAFIRRKKLRCENIVIITAS
ncbi:hypothetical protein [Klebsiella quasipneumoniae]|uniref:hypothetical protein n=1 Tax=Klebsiella quasipneumoniae TaxID=1463165 RepID=UPI002964D693|nr:hypothetical protein [Klebsiella quasipneumoniae]